mmetsp:Transcript_12573/g.31784  ORF Transcript_12573/g.31784 Transcript_12573/m.31784 type:complete len:218 (-) Transcript_12573:2171-2824(-)
MDRREFANLFAQAASLSTHHERRFFETVQLQPHFFEIHRVDRERRLFFFGRRDDRVDLLFDVGRDQTNGYIRAAARDELDQLQCRQYVVSVDRRNDFVERVHFGGIRAHGASPKGFFRRQRNKEVQRVDPKHVLPVTVTPARPQQARPVVLQAQMDRQLFVHPQVFIYVFKTEVMPVEFRNAQSVQKINLGPRALQQFDSPVPNTLRADPSGFVALR